MESLIEELLTEVRQSLREIIGMLELTRDPGPSDVQSQYLSNCLAFSHRLLNKANDFAELNREDIEPLKIVLFSVSETVGEVAELMGMLAGRKGIALDWSVTPSVPPCSWGDMILIRECLQRLLYEAIQLEDTGTVLLTVTAVTAGSNSAILCFEILRSGPEAKSEISGASDKRAGEPRDGLGLRIVRKQLARLGGELSLGSDFPRGGTARMNIPVVSAATPSDRSRVGEQSRSDPQPLSRLKLLVVEDSDECFDLFQVYTNGEGHETRRARNGAEGVEMAKSGEFDLIVMDIRMPVMDGYTATELIRVWETEEQRTRMPILLLSADDLERQSRIGPAVGCSGYLAKPATRENVLEALRFYSNTVPGGAGSSHWLGLPPFRYQ